MVTFPRCKINLGLNILSKRPDGYHDINTCFYPVPWTDILEIIPSNELSFTCSGNSIPGNTADNLCLRAYYLLKKDYNIDPVKIHLHKIIPLGAGLGGGSSDGAHTLRTLNDIFSLQLSDHVLQRYAAQLGSDCSFFIQNKPKLGSGRGEVLSEIKIDLTGKFLVIIKPDVHISTIEAYAGVIPQIPEIELQDILERHALSDWKEKLRNDFESSIFKRNPLIEKIKNSFYSLGASYVSMSGSGSSVFAIFEKPVDVNHQFEDYTHWCGTL